MKKYNRILYRKYFQALIMIGKAQTLEEFNKIINLKNVYYALGKKRKIFFGI